MDVRMPTMDGIEATAHHRSGRARLPRGTGRSPTRVLMLTTFDLDDHVYGAAGRGEWVPAERRSRGQLIEAVRVVARGDAAAAPSVTRRLIEEVAKRPLVDPHTSVRGFGELTDREPT
ncbi:MAG: hypothetical protein R2713_15190 [Ilumatobacteraceae bacterium]